MFAVTQLNCSSKYEIFINEGIINTENLHGFKCFFCFLSFHTLSEEALTSAPHTNGQLN